MYKFQNVPMTSEELLDAGEPETLATGQRLLQKLGGFSIWGVPLREVASSLPSVFTSGIRARNETVAGVVAVSCMDIVLKPHIGEHPAAALPPTVQ
jgi:hypothetical protein